MVPAKERFWNTATVAIRATTELALNPESSYLRSNYVHNRTKHTKER